MAAELPENKFPGRNKIVRDFLSDFEAVREFYYRCFRQEDDVAAAMADAKEYPHPREEVSAALVEQNRKFGAGERSIENAKAVSGGESFCIVTGQQVGLLTGPLYTIYKAVTAVKLAGHLSAKYGAKFIPVFWMASNDHDFEEVRQVYAIGAEENPCASAYTPLSPPGDRPLGKVMLDDSFSGFVRELKSCLPGTEFSRDAFGMVESSYLPGESISDGFGRMMAKLFGDSGLVLLDPSDPAMKKPARPVFEKEISNPLQSTRIVNAAAERLAAGGYKPQVRKSAHRTGIFLEMESGARKPLSYRDGRFYPGDANESFTAAELFGLLDGEPGRFSPNVFLRPIVQGRLLPTAAYVAGPSEIAYFAQLRGIYELFDVPEPLVFPRVSLTLVPPATTKLLDRLGLAAHELASGADEVFSRCISENLESELERLVDNPARKIEAVLDEISGGLADFDKGLRDAAGPARRRILHQIDALRKKVLKSGRQTHGQLRGKIAGACNWTFPLGKPQERMLCIIGFLARYGTGIIDRLFAEADIFSDRHQVIEI